MKRSKALNLIANQLDFLNDKFEGSKDNFTEQEIKNADVILTTLESAGMYPPQVLIPGKWQHRGSDMFWEKENE